MAMKQELLVALLPAPLRNLAAKQNAEVPDHVVLILSLFFGGFFYLWDSTQ
jgi:hypothetical protein